MKKAKNLYVAMLIAVMFTLFLSGCGSSAYRTDQNSSSQTTEKKETSGNASLSEQKSASEGEIADQNSDEQKVQATADATAGGDEVQSAESGSMEIEEQEPVVPGSDLPFEEWINRPVGSANLFSDKTILVSIFLEEPEKAFSEEDKAAILQRQKIAYDFVMDSLKEYGVTHELIYDWSKHPDLCYEMKIAEAIPAYVTTEQEHELDEKEDKWIDQIPTMELLQTYDTDSIAYLFWIPHEGVSYSSMHFLEDGNKTWHEINLMYLRDYYSKTLDYETPAVYAHELLHLFGAEDLYKGADVFDSSVYDYAYANYRNDIMIDQFETIGGKAVPCQSEVKQVITPITAMLLGIMEVPEIEEACPELIREEKGCFPGSTYDRPF